MNGAKLDHGPELSLCSLCVMSIAVLVVGLRGIVFVISVLAADLQTPRPFCKSKLPADLNRGRLFEANVYVLTGIPQSSTPCGRNPHDYGLALCSEKKIEKENEVKK
jgi:hypothetical protein